MACARRSRSPQRATLPACIRVVDAPFLIVISAPSLELGNPHGSRCGYAQANAGQDTSALLGHKNIQHTVRCTELAPDRFKDFWRSKPAIPNYISFVP